MAILARSRPPVSPRNLERRRARGAVLPAYSGGAVGGGQALLALVAGWRLPLAVLAGVAVLAGPVPLLQAFPPAPFSTVYGDVRDQYGALIPADGAAVVVYKDGKEIMRQSLVAAEGTDFNYQLRLRIDMLRASTTTYSSVALTSGTVYTLAVSIGSQLYYPIEMATPPLVGSASARRRLNLTLGVDSDGDGLPDAWEEAQLYHGSYLPGADGWDLSLIDKNGDLDKDGVSNYTEYVAGTYATDSSSVLSVSIKEKLATSARLEFYAFYGKSYTLESTTDLKTWAAVPFSLSDPAAPDAAAAQSSLTSTVTEVISIYADAAAQSTYYRLIAR